MAQQTAPEAAPRSAPASDGGGSGAARILKRPVGPFPVWVWLAVVGGLVGWRVWAARKGSTSGTSGTGDTATSGDTGVPADQVPQFVNQTYTTVTPPSAPGGSVHPPMSPKPMPLVHQYPPPVNLKATSASKNGVTLSWQARPVGSIYPPSSTVAVFDAKGRRVSESTVNSPDSTGGITTTTLTGLPANTQLHAQVWSNGGAVAPKGTVVNFRTAR